MDGAAPIPDILSEVFGHTGFRPLQEDIVAAVTAGQDTLAILPTGGGKSLCFQLPALLRPGLTVVISPLIALMRDQLRALKEQGVAAGALTSANTEEETAEVWAGLESGGLKILYMAPERLASGGTDRMLSQANVTLLAVDEAHCVSQWGHDFRPDYLRIGSLRRALDVQGPPLPRSAAFPPPRQLGTHRAAAFCWVSSFELCGAAVGRSWRVV